jgi:hypothetical protein
VGDEKIRPMPRYVRSRTGNVPGSSDIADIDLLTAYQDDAKVGGETRQKNIDEDYRVLFIEMKKK